jgi:hypothetical protein
LKLEFSDAFCDGVNDFPPTSTEARYLDDWGKGRVNYDYFINSPDDHSHLLKSVASEPPIVFVNQGRLEKIAGATIIRRIRRTSKMQLTFLGLEESPSLLSFVHPAAEC